MEVEGKRGEWESETECGEEKRERPGVMKGHVAHCDKCSLNL